MAKRPKKICPECHANLGVMSHKMSCSYESRRRMLLGLVIFDGKDVLENIKECLQTAKK